MNIAIIDDSIEESCHLSHFIETYCSDAHLSQNTSVFTSTTRFLKSWRSGAFDLVFVDIYFGDTPAGIRLAERIRRDDSACSIIFTTVSTDFALAGFEIRALDYLVKPISYSKFCHTMDFYLAHLPKKQSPYIEVKESRIMVKIPIDSILYTDYFNHYIQIHLDDKIIRTYMRFAEFSPMLLDYPQFICCYRNCIINMDKVAALEKTEFIITSGEHLPITRNLRPQIHQEYADYQFHKLNGGNS